jgi:hypothetical protein
VVAKMTSTLTPLSFECLSLRMLRDPSSGSKAWAALDREIGNPGENRGQIGCWRRRWRSGPRWSIRPYLRRHCGPDNVRAHGAVRGRKFDVFIADDDH